jgi:hypothetical protein
MTSEQESHAGHSGEEVEKTSSVHSNREGDAHQAALGPKPKRKHFFSPLDPTYADAVHRDAEAVEFTAEEEVRGSVTLVHLVIGARWVIGGC